MRVVAGLAGVLLLAGGVLALCAGLGAFGPDAAGAAVLSAATERYVRDHDWFWPLAGAVAEVVALAGLVGFGGTVREARLRRRPAMDGATRMHARAASGDLVRDVVRMPGVRDVRVRLTGTPARPRLVLTVDCAPDACPGDLHAALGGEPVARFRDAVGMQTLLVVVRYRLAEPSPEPDPLDVPADADVEAFLIPRARRRGAADGARTPITDRDVG
ncbi:alkaline shock response membrane anchor protein AmaP [Actinomadura rupiterrae]|uniref:alkaline shock response membrane anchor protein AmaP n=1 Tax=Actinomadura rupiterrae TaxID=559627 RepID=UPI0020A47F09|nr:alkaline shock response membrane anchor protein AmaP [Actinomadura rupiterrae]MCP2334876.1 hypothetical protein [Actinomadura rupiterrae]